MTSGMALIGEGTGRKMIGKKPTLAYFNIDFLEYYFTTLNL